jgi:ATP-dependent RNA helicase TDRD9
VSRQTSFRKVGVDKDSVNYVVLEPDYLSKHTRMLVSASMGLRQNSGNITLRDTTLMPNIRGFPALMSLLFAPRFQLRVDSEQRQYVGAICGLGFDGRTLKGYDADYDSEVSFVTRFCCPF